MKYIAILLLCVAGLVSAQTNAKKIDAQVAALLKKMTLDEKIGQMTQVDYAALTGHHDDIVKYSLGSILWGGSSEVPDITAKGWAASYDTLQALSQKTRLKIPIIFGVDAVHGHNNVEGAVIFPHNIGLGATRNPKVVENSARITAAEMRGTGIQWDFAPCVAVARNERWGRTYESFGEDPELASLLGAAYVRGMQGDDISNAASALACVKHYLADGGTTNGKDQGNSEMDEATLRAVHLPGYVEGIKAGAKSMMPSYSSWNGVKMHGNKYLLTDVLKKELGFNGFLVSDWAAIDQLDTNYSAAIAKSVNAGLDMAMIPNGHGQNNNYMDFISKLKELVKKKKVPMSRIDDAVKRILTVKLEMNLAGNLYSNKELLMKVGSAEHREAAREAVRQSLVLLKNEKNVLPLAKSGKNIHVAGKWADSIGAQCGGWTIGWQGSSGNVTSGGTTILQAVKNTVAAGTKVSFSVDGRGADSNDVAVVIAGEEPYAEMFGDREDLTLSASDLAVVNTLKAKGIPVVVILLSGRPLIIDAALQKSDAFVAAWLPGTEGQGVADVLFGDYAPTGKLPHSWPRTMSQIPVNTGDKNYDPLFPYGFGLTFAPVKTEQK
jgi:beta-glucosidase